MTAPEPTRPADEHTDAVVGVRRGLPGDASAEEG